MKKFTSPTQKIGELGEDIACKWLKNKDFLVVDRNYTKKWGEIDIVAQKGNKIHFIEVKSSRLRQGFGGQAKKIAENGKNVSGETGNSYNPAENMHPWKVKRFVRAVETYLMTSKGQKIKDWQIDLLVVYIDTEKRVARCEIFENIV